MPHADTEQRSESRRLCAGLTVSTEEQADNNISIPAQKARIAAYCQAQGWDVHDYYVDDGYSGKSLDRPQMQRLLQDARKRAFSVVVVLKLDRLSRRQKDTLFVLEDIFDPAGIGFKSVTEPVDTTSPFGRAALGMLAVFAQLERETIVERVRDAKKEAAKQGRFMGGKIPYGYRHNIAAKSLEIDESQADVVRWIVAEYLKGDKGYATITDDLNRRGVPAPRAKQWNQVQVRKILTSPLYVGKLPHRGKLHSGKHPAIIDQDDFDAVQHLLVGRDRFAPPSDHSGLVSGIVYCGECGARCRTKNTWQNYPETNPKRVIRYYVCYTREGSTSYMMRGDSCGLGYIRAEMVDDQVAHRLRQVSLNPKMAREEAKAYLHPPDAERRPKLLASLRKELSTVTARIDRWYDAFEKGSLPPDDLADRVRTLRERKAYIEGEIAAAEEATTRESFRRESLEARLAELRDFPHLWEEATEQERQALVRNLVKRVTIQKDGTADIELFPE